MTSCGYTHRRLDAECSLIEGAGAAIAWGSRVLLRGRFRCGAGSPQSAGVFAVALHGDCELIQIHRVLPSAGLLNGPQSGRSGDRRCPPREGFPIPAVYETLAKSLAEPHRDVKMTPYVGQEAHVVNIVVRFDPSDPSAGSGG